MAVQPQARVYTPDDLWELAHNEEDRHYELIEGAIIEMPPPSAKHGLVTTWLSSLIVMHVDEHDLGDVTTETGYQLSTGNVFGPDIAFVSKARLPAETPEKYYQLAPDLAVEVISPSDRWVVVRQKVELYLKNGSQVVWLVFPDERLIDVYHADGKSSTYRGDDVLDGGDVLPGFSVKASDLFKRLRD